VTLSGGLCGFRYNRHQALCILPKGHDGPHNQSREVNRQTPPLAEEVRLIVRQEISRVLEAIAQTEPPWPYGVTSADRWRLVAELTSETPPPAEPIRPAPQTASDEKQAHKNKDMEGGGNDE